MTQPIEQPSFFLKKRIKMCGEHDVIKQPNKNNKLRRVVAAKFFFHLHTGLHFFRNTT
jgi:hypothetical protein